MKARTVFRLAAGICVLAILLAGVSRHAAVAGGTVSQTVTIPTQPDICIQDWVSPAMSEVNAGVAHNPDDDEYLVVFDWEYFGAGDRDIMFV